MVSKKMFNRSALLMLSIGLYGIAPAKEHAPVQKDEVGTVPAIQMKEGIEYQQGLLHGIAHNQPVKHMLAAVGRFANLEIEQRYKPSDTETVSYQMNGVRLREALKKLLEDYSYLFIPAGEDNTPGKLILLDRKDGEHDPQNQIQADIVSAHVQFEEQNELEAARHSSEKKKKVSGPRSLDDFLSLDKLKPKLAYEPESDEQRRTREEQEAGYAEACLQRALAALESDYENLYEQALAALQRMDSPEATAALLEAAQGIYSKTADLQYYAAETLSNRAADFGYSNQLANDALKQLTGSKLPAIKDVAEKALDDMNYYLLKKQAGTRG